MDIKFQHIYVCHSSAMLTTFGATKAYINIVCSRNCICIPALGHEYETSSYYWLPYLLTSRKGIPLLLASLETKKQVHRGNI